MAKRIHVPELHVGRVALDAAEAHHARDVLRLADGAEVEAFDDAGNVASAVFGIEGAGCFVEIERIEQPRSTPAISWTIAAAVPKGQRADWMIEKLSELGAAVFVPLQTARSVVLPEGRNKIERWRRIATESAKQCRRAGVMRIDELTALSQAIEQAGAGSWVLTTEMTDAISFADAAKKIRQAPRTTLFVGPEGGWADSEIAAFTQAGIAPVRLGPTILRVETAAMAAAVLLGTLLA